MKGKKPRSLAEMAATSARVAGRLECPRCGCQYFRTYKTIKGHVETFRYKSCDHCGHKMLTTQSPEKIVRDVETSETGSDEEIEGLTGEIV